MQGQAWSFVPLEAADVQPKAGGAQAWRRLRQAARVCTRGRPSLAPRASRRGAFFRPLGADWWGSMPLAFPASLPAKGLQAV
jgi:hypothetical protein